MQTQNSPCNTPYQLALEDARPVRRNFDGALQLFDHGHIQMAFHARIFKTGELCIPGHAPEYVAIRFVNFRFNTVQDRFDAVYMVIRDGQDAGEFFASAFRHLWL